MGWLNCYGVRLAPSFADSLCDKAGVSTKSATPLAVGQRFTHVSDHVVRSFVVVLRAFVSPAAVFLEVTGVVVNSVYRVVARAFAHVGVKNFKDEPLIADIYPTRSVFAVRRIFGVSASAKHVRPASVRACSEHSMSYGAGLRNLFSKATAGCGCTSFEGVSRYGFTTAARAGAVPFCFSSTTCLGLSDNSKSAKCLTRKVFESCHFVTSKLITVKKAWQAAVIQLFGSYPSQAGAFYHG